MLPEFFRELITLLWQPNLGKNLKKKLQQLGHNFGPMQNTFGICVQRMFRVTEFTHAEYS